MATIYFFRKDRSTYFFKVLENARRVQLYEEDQLCWDLNTETVSIQPAHSAGQREDGGIRISLHKRGRKWIVS